LASDLRCGGPALRVHGECESLRFLDRDAPALEGAFRTPTLRNVARSGPYMHGGHFARLDEVIEFYRALPGRASIGERDPMLHVLPRSVRTSDLVAFLESLDGGPVDAQWRGATR
ncbi:MAG: cytochrome-c peroxidase, partial [Myxococcota bacterium]|nr:cytochrome-c peroxidase [Myxococcota bacterium]